MEREQIFGVVKKHLMEAVPDLREAAIDPAKSMKDLGANSLDIVEVVSCSMREINVKVPRAELAKLKNIGDLVELLHGVKHAAARQVT